jgi:hypothetical protein
MRAFVVAIGAVRFVRSGRRLVPENFGMTPSSLLCVVVVDVVGPAREPSERAVPSRTAATVSPARPHLKEARLSQLTG